MTHEEIEATIERLKSMDDSPYNGKYESGHILIEFMHSALSTNAEFRDRLINLLRQADPDTHMELPVDADGNPIHVGDKMDCGERFGVQEVDGFVHGAVAFTVFDPQPARICTCPAHMTHHHKSTVEDLLIELSNISFDVVEDDEFKELIAEYAKKIREVMADD
jgi:hypothetical protein